MGNCQLEQVLYWCYCEAVAASRICSLCPQTPPSHDEKRFGEPSRTSWANVRFCDNVNLAHFAASLLKKGVSTQMEMNKLYCCKESAM